MPVSKTSLINELFYFSFFRLHAMYKEKYRQAHLLLKENLNIVECDQ
jgi:hypothetical protein